MLLAFVKDKWPILAVCLIFGGRQYSKHMTGVAVRSVTPAQELVTLKKHAMSEHQLSSLRSHLEAALPSLEGQYLGRGFANTRGFVLKFNTQGAAKLRDPDFMNGTYSFLSPFFETFRDPAANAFVLNALVVPAGGSADEARDPAVGLHVDNTVGIDSARPRKRPGDPRRWPLTRRSPQRYASSSRTPSLSSMSRCRTGWRAANSSSGRTPTSPSRRQSLPPRRGASLPRRACWPSSEATRTTSSTAGGCAKAAARAAAGAGTAAAAAGASARGSLVLEAYQLDESFYSATTEFEVNRNHDHRVYATEVRPLLLQFNDLTKWCLRALLGMTCWLSVEAWTKRGRKPETAKSETLEQKQARILRERGERGGSAPGKAKGAAQPGATRVGSSAKKRR